jgi:hypothetical protein
MENRLRGKMLIAILVLVMTMLLIALFGIALMLDVDPAARGPAYDIIRWLEAVLTPYLAIMQEWMEYFVRKFAELRVTGIGW